MEQPVAAVSVGDDGDEGDAYVGEHDADEDAATRSDSMLVPLLLLLLLLLLLWFWFPPPAL